MTRGVKVLRNTGFVLIVLFGVVGALMVAGYAFQDLSLWAAIGSTAAWLVPMVVLSVVAMRSERVAPPTFVVLTVVVGALTILASSFGWVGRDGRGPVAAIGIFALAVALGFLGLRRTALAGVLLVVLGLAQLAAAVVELANAGAEGPGPGLSHILSSSSGVVVLPVVLVGLLYLAAGGMGHDTVRVGHVPPPRVAH